MRIIVYDIEVFQYDWFVIFLDLSSQQWFVYHNNNQAVRDFLSQPGIILCGFNNKHYDNHIVKAIACGADNALVKEINDFIIVQERQGWEHWFLRQNRFWFDSFDLMDDTQVGTSLKHIEAHLGVNIEETEVDFNLDRPLTREEIQSTIHYCKWDVYNTAKLLTLRKNYLEAKLAVGREIGLPDTASLYMTNARLTAKALRAEYIQRYDERKFQYPSNLMSHLIPPDVIDFFDRIHDDTIPDSVLFNSNLKFDIDGGEAVVGFGGIHHAQKNYFEKCSGNRVIRNFDVASLYPSLMVYNGLTSRNIPSSAIFEKFYHTRLQAKSSGDKKTANTLKLILNTTYGASLAKTNPLYDPLMGRSVCITGQLYILELAMRYMAACSSLRLIQLNTDGLMISLEKDELPKIYCINQAWQKEKHLTLEEDKIQAVYQKDVNNYIIRFENGKVKTKGAYVTYGMSPAGAFSINNNYTIVKKAVIEYFVHGTPVENTIDFCTDIHDFMIIAKAGGGYESVYCVPDTYEGFRKSWEKENRFRVEGRKGWVTPPWRWDCYTGPQLQVQRVNRIYATTTGDTGALVKVKPDGSVGRISNVPERFTIDNKNELTIDHIDRSWYVDMARKYIKDYTG